MKNEQEIREYLINNTIRLIAEGGFEKATTKAITYDGAQTLGLKMNEVYIYRLFGGKEKLYAKAFERLDEEFVFSLRRCLHDYNSLDGCVKEKMYATFLRVWQFLLRNEEWCRCYVRYYYSIYFKGKSLEKHNQLFSVIVEAFSTIFRPEADVKAIMHSTLTIMLDFAIRVHNGDLENNDENRPHVFNVLYCTMESYFKDEIRKEANSMFIGNA